MSQDFNKILKHTKKDKFLHIITEFINGLDSLGNIAPCVSFFGSSRVAIDSKYAKIATLLAKELSSRGISIITGGGPGIMAAANKGTQGGSGTSIGLNMEFIHRHELPNLHQDIALKFRYFFTRKATFFAHSCAYIIFPGGYGTLDEATEILTMLQTHKLQLVPVIFVGSDFWHGFISWLQEQPLNEGMLTKEHLALFKVTDNLEEIISLIQNVSKNNPHNTYSDL